MIPKLGKRFSNIIVIILCVFLFLLFLYLTGLIAQLVRNYNIYIQEGAFISGKKIALPSPRIFICLQSVFTPTGGIVALIELAVIALLTLYFRFKHSSNNQDSRGFSLSSKGTYGTAGWMSDQELLHTLQLSSVSHTDGIILGVHHSGKIISIPMPKDTVENRNILVIGAAGTWKSSSIIRPALFTAILRRESVVVTDPKGELYRDTSSLFQSNGYKVRVLNLISPAHSDGWNPMAETDTSSLMATILTNIIIENTSSPTGKSDPYWVNGESGLLKALILYVKLNSALKPEQKTLPTVYELLSQKPSSEIIAMFDALPKDHPAKEPFNVFKKGSDNVRSSWETGVLNRLQIMQDKTIADVLRHSDIDLTAPASERCAYFVILDTQDSSMEVISSMFFSLLFKRLSDFAVQQPSGSCPVKVNLILDEFLNIGKIGGTNAQGESNFLNTLSTVRGYGIRTTMVIQDLGRLQARYPSTQSNSITGNCAFQLMLGCNDDITAEYFSKLSGEITTSVISTSETRRTYTPLQIIPAYQHREGEGRRRLLTPDEVRRLKRSELLIYVEHCNMLKAEKFSYWDHPMYRQIEGKQTLMSEYIPEWKQRELEGCQDNTTHPLQASESSPIPPAQPASQAKQDAPANSPAPDLSPRAYGGFSAQDADPGRFFGNPERDQRTKSTKRTKKSKPSQPSTLYEQISMEEIQSHDQEEPCEIDDPFNL